MTKDELTAIKKRALAVLQAVDSPIKDKPELRVWDVLALIAEVERLRAQIDAWDLPKTANVQRTERPLPPPTE